MTVCKYMYMYIYTFMYIDIKSLGVYAYTATHIDVYRFLGLMAARISEMSHGSIGIQTNGCTDIHNKIRL